MRFRDADTVDAADDYATPAGIAAADAATPT